MNLLMFHVERRGLGMVLGCGSPPLLVVVGIGVSRETIPLMEAYSASPHVIRLCKLRKTKLDDIFFLFFRLLV